jgi:hypothetical protein
MGGLFSSPSPPTPAVPPPPPVPEVDEEAKRRAQLRARRRSGRSETIVTGELEPITTKKRLLG